MEVLYETFPGVPLVQSVLPARDVLLGFVTLMVLREVLHWALICDGGSISVIGLFVLLVYTTKLLVPVLSSLTTPAGVCTFPGLILAVTVPGLVADTSMVYVLLLSRVGEPWQVPLVTVTSRQTNELKSIDRLNRTENSMRALLVGVAWLLALLRVTVSGVVSMVNVRPFDATERAPVAVVCLAVIVCIPEVKGIEGMI